MAESAPNIVDSRPSALVSFLNAAEFEKQLGQLSSAEWNWGPVQEIQTRVLKCHPGKRCTFEITMRTERGSHELIGKVFTEDRSDVHEIMAGIQEAGFRGDSQFAIPSPITYLPSLRLLLEEKAYGMSVREVFLEKESDNQKEAAVRCALWLAKFHSTAPRIGPVSSVTKLMSKSRSQARKLSRLGGRFAEKAGYLLAKLEVGLNDGNRGDLPGSRRIQPKSCAHARRSHRGNRLGRLPTQGSRAGCRNFHDCYQVAGPRPPRSHRGIRLALGCVPANVPRRTRTGHSGTAPFSPGSAVLETCQILRGLSA